MGKRLGSRQKEVAVTTSRLGAALLIALAVMVSACSALPAATSQPSDQPTSAPSSAATPVATPNANLAATPDPTATPQSTAMSSPADTPSAATPIPSSVATSSPLVTTEPSSAWTVERVLRDHKYKSLSMVIDAEGAVHAAAGEGRGLVYLTNETGEWVQTQLSMPPGSEGDSDSEPSLGIDANGTMAVAFSRGQCMMMGCGAHQILVAANESGTWSEPVAVAGGDAPSLAIRDGAIHVAYAASEGSTDVACGDPVPIRYVTNVTGDWLDTPVSEDGDWLGLQVGTDGLPRVMFTNYCGFVGDAGLYYAKGTPSGQFEIEPVPNTTAEESRLADLVLDDSDNPHSIFWTFTEEEDSNHYLLRDDGEWLSSVIDAPAANVTSIALGPDGVAHLLAQGDHGTWYLSNRSGDFQFGQLSDAPTIWLNASGIAADESGRPHLLFAVGEYDRTRPGLIYAVGPTP